MERKTLRKLKCQRCGYEWWPRFPKKPLICPNRECGSLRWDEPGPEPGYEENGTPKADAGR